MVERFDEVKTLAAFEDAFGVYGDDVHNPSWGGTGADEIEGLVVNPSHTVMLARVPGALSADESPGHGMYSPDLVRAAMNFAGSLDGNVRVHVQEDPDMPVLLEVVGTEYGVLLAPRVHK